VKSIGRPVAGLLSEHTAQHVAEQGVQTTRLTGRAGLSRGITGKLEQQAHHGLRPIPG